MTLLISGLILWWAAHLFKRVAPAARARMGGKGRGVVALALLVSLALMVLGYRGAELLPVYTPIAGIGHLNNLLMFVSLFLFGVAPSRGVLSDRIRHPMLLGTAIWAFAHLLVNGDLASIMLFGGLGAWAITEMFVINATEAGWNRPEPGSLKGDAGNLIITVILFAIITGIHVWAGRNPFLGTYG